MGTISIQWRPLGGAGGGVFNSPDGTFSSAGTFRFQNTILAGNVDFSPFVGMLPNECAGTIISEGNNLMGDFNLNCTVNGGGVTFVSAAGNAVGVGLLQNNSSPTQSAPTHTHALLPGSPALDAG